MSPVNVEQEAGIAITGRDANGSVRKSIYSKITEDGWALWIGGFLIAVVLIISFVVTDFKFTSPVYQWSDSHDLLTKLLSAQNLVLIAGIGSVFTVLSLVAVWLSGGSPKKYVAAFVVVYVLAIISLMIAGNVSFNTMRSNSSNDIFVTGFNTPKWSTNLSFGNREVIKNIGFNIVWKWQDAFLWESPLVTGNISAYNTIDAQVSFHFPKLKSQVKLGGADILNHRYLQYAGGPTLGALYYVTVTVDGLLNK